MRFSKLFFALFWGVLLSLSFSSAFVFKLNINDSELEAQLSKNYSRIHFNAGGNDFGGTIFWLNQLDPLGDTIKISDDDAGIYCSHQMRGLYHNSQRWDNRLWPLDQTTADVLWYDSDLLEGGLYTNCVPGITWQDFGIYGYLVHNYEGKKYELLAGVQYDGKGNKVIDNSVLRPTLQKIESLDDYPLWFLYDNRGGGIWFLWCRANTGFNLMTALASFGWFSKVFDSDLEEGIPVVNAGAAQEAAHEAVAYLETVGMRPEDYFDVTAEDLGVGEVDVECLDIPPSLFQVLFLKIQWIIGTSTSSEKSSVGTIQQVLWKETSKTQFFSSVNLNNATLINQAKKQAESLCRGKWKYNASDFNSKASVNCMQLERGEISLSMEDLEETTLILRNGNIKLFSSKTTASTPPLNIFIDGGKLILKTDGSHRQNFDDKGFPVGNGSGVASGVLINGNLIINWLITNESDEDFKYYLHGKFSSLNTYSTPEWPRIQQLNNLLGEGNYVPIATSEENGEVDLTEVFRWRCPFGTAWTDGSNCSQELDNEFRSSPFNVIDKYYPWILL